jgi:hypothetical protein
LIRDLKPSFLQTPRFYISLHLKRKRSKKKKKEEEEEEKEPQC